MAALAAIHAATGTAYLYGVYHPAGIALNNVVLPLFIAAFYWGLIQEPRSCSACFPPGRGSPGPQLVCLLPGAHGAPSQLPARVRGSGRRASSARAAASITGAILGNVAGLFVFVTLLSIALYGAIERPANRFLRRRFGGVSAG